MRGEQGTVPLLSLGHPTEHAHSRRHAGCSGGELQSDSSSCPGQTSHACPPSCGGHRPLREAPPPPARRALLPRRREAERRPGRAAGAALPSRPLAPLAAAGAGSGRSLLLLLPPALAATTRARRRRCRDCTRGESAPPGPARGKLRRGPSAPLCGEQRLCPTRPQPPRPPAPPVPPPRPAPLPSAPPRRYLPALCSPPPLFPRCRLHLRHRPRDAAAQRGALRPCSRSGFPPSRSRFAGEEVQTQLRGSGGSSLGGAGAARRGTASGGSRVLWELPPPPGPARPAAMSGPQRCRHFPRRVAGGGLC